MEPKNYPPYLDCPKPDPLDCLSTVELNPLEKKYSKMSDDKLCKELQKIQAQQKELKEKEKIIQRIRSYRYTHNNWFNEELNSCEPHI